MNLFRNLAILILSVTLPQSIIAQDVDPFANLPTPAFAGQTNAPAPAQTSSFRVQKVVSNLSSPRSLAVLPDGNVLVTEGSGTVRVIKPDGSVSGPIAGMPAIRSVGGRSMNDFILDANFAENRRVFLTYAGPPDGEPGGARTPQEREAWAALPETERLAKPFTINRVTSARLSEDNSRLENVKIIYNVSGRRLVSSRDGMLYITTWGFGEQRPLVQQLTNTIGKVLRINADGSIPADNPFIDHDNTLAEIYSFGHRDPDGAFIHPESGELWTIEHGPMGGDEINIIHPGNNYGWAEVTYGRNYDGTEVSKITQREGTEQPVYYWYPSVAPSGLMMYTGDLFPEWKGNIFAGAMSPAQGKFLVRLIMDGERVIAEEHLLTDLDRRIRSVAQGIDGALYVLTDSENNDQTNRHFAGEVLKLTPIK